MISINYLARKWRNGCAFACRSQFPVNCVKDVVLRFQVNIAKNPARFWELEEKCEPNRRNIRVYFKETLILRIIINKTRSYKSLEFVYLQRKTVIYRITQDTFLTNSSQVCSKNNDYERL